MTMTELHAHWDERERRYAQRRRASLSDEDRAVIAAYRRSEVARLIANTPIISTRLAR